MATTFFSSVRHVWRLGPTALWLDAAALLLALVAVAQSRHRRGWMLWILLLLGGWVVIGLGLVDGAWATIQVFGHSLLPDTPLFRRVQPGSFGFLSMGLLAGVSALVALSSGTRFLLAARRAGTPAVSRAQAWVPAAAALIAAGFIARDVHRSVSHDAVRIGVIVPLRGPTAEMTKPFLAAVELAVAEHQANLPYRLIVADSGPNGSEARHAVETLLYKERVDAIVGGISASGQLVKPYATLERVPHLCVCSVSTIGDGRYNFTNIPLPEDEAMAWVREAQARGIETVAALTQDYPSIQGHMNALAREIARSDLRLLDAREFPGGTTDFAALVGEMAALHPDVYMIEAFNPSLDALGRELQRRGIHNAASIVAISVSAEPALFDGTWYTDSYLDPTFRARFERAARGTRLVTHMVPYAYDATRMVIDAFESGQDPVAYLRTLTAYDGPAGRLSRDEASGNFRSRPAVWEIRAGKPVLLHH